VKLETVSKMTLANPNYASQEPTPTPLVTPDKDKSVSAPDKGADELKGFAVTAVKFLRSNFISLASAGIVAVGAFFSETLKEKFESYIRGVVYPGYQSVSQKQLDDQDFINTTLAINRYIRHVVLPTMKDPARPLGKLDTNTSIVDADKNYSDDATKHIQHVLFPDNDKGTIDESIVAWIQSKIKSDKPEPGAIARVLAENHSIVTDAIIGGIYSGSVRLNKDTPIHRVPVLVPAGHTVKLAYIIDEPPTFIRTPTPLNYWVMRLGGSTSVPEKELSRTYNKPLNITFAFDAVREPNADPDANLIDNIFFVQIGFISDKLNKDLEDLYAQFKGETKPPDQSVNVVYAIIVERAISNNISEKRTR